MGLDEVTVVVVPLTTLTLTGAELDARKFESPLYFATRVLGPEGKTEIGT